MRPSKNELVLRRTIKFSKADLNSSSVINEISENADSIGGVIRKGQLGWLARGPLIEVFSLRNGNKISSYRFDIATSSKRCFITCVSEIEASNLNCCLLAVGIQFGDDSGGMISIFSVQESKVVRSIETADKVTCCHLVHPGVVERTLLQMFQGCLAVGTDVGKVILLDLCLNNCEQTLNELRTSDDDLFLVPCHVVFANMSRDHIAQHFRHSRRENVGFGIQLEVVDSPELVLSLVSLKPLLSLAVGLEDGRMILYDLTDLQAFHLAYPPEDLSPLVKLSYLEPPDDPRACLYIWAFHEQRRSSVAVMHSVMYDKKVMDDDEDDGFYLFEGFQSCSVRLTLPMYERNSVPIACQSVTKHASHDSEETISLSLLAWKSQQSAEVLIFDINQWYKEQMPNMGDWRDNLSYLASFPLKEINIIGVWLEGRTIAPFNSIHRPEEHFFPVSLSFDCIVFRDKDTMKFHWAGLQNKALNMLNMAGPTALLEPSVYYHEIAKASLVSQSSPDYSFSSNLSINVQREALLSVALEYNCFGLLKECAKCWADGSHLGRKRDEGLSLSTMTNWLWRRAENIKERCNTLCVPLFDHSGFRLDQRSQNELSYCSRQLKILTELMNIIITKCSDHIPEDVKSTLSTQYNSIKMASDYQDVLQWLLNVGLLPEATLNRQRITSFANNSFESRNPIVPYPYKELKNFYMTKRMNFKKINSGLLSPRTQSCRILYIDSFIDHECNANVLREHWQESGGNGLYPPPSLQALLRILLVPDVSIESKYALFVYFFLDLNSALEDDGVKHAEMVQSFMKFPSVFKLSSSTIKIIQAFWNLDHGQFEIAVEDIISPFLHDHKLNQWQKELLIEALLVHHASKLALRALQAPGAPVSSLLELKTLLANDMVAEAFHLQRSKNDHDLFRQFLTGCHYLGKMGALLDLALTEDEDTILEEFLRDSKSAKTENLHFVHLLQRSKYIEAVQQLDELSQNKHNQRSVDLETPNLVLAAYNTTMTPATKHLSEVYYGIRNRLKAKEPELQQMNTLSSELLRHNADNLVGGVYHRSIMSVDEATNYWDEGIQRERKRLLYPGNVPFIRRPQLEAFTGYQGESNLCYPDVYRGSQKRRLDKSDDIETDKDTDSSLNANPTKRQKITDTLSGTKTAEPLNTTLLTRFKGRPTIKAATSEHNLTAQLSNQCRYEKDSSLLNLNTPIVKSSRNISASRDDSMSEVSEISKFDCIGTPQSILKVRNAAGGVCSPRKAAESTPRRSASPRVLETNDYADDEKSIRFDLPSANITDNSSLQTSHESLEMSQRVPSTSMASANIDGMAKITEITKRYDGPSPRKTLRSSDASLMETSDDENFFSPQHSRDNSIKKIDANSSDSDEDSNKDGNSTQIDREYKQNVDQKFRIPDGPKPRKPLNRSSRSRSKTPEIPASPTRKSTRLSEKSKTQDVEINEMKTDTIRQSSSKSLSRFVLETNAMKKMDSSIRLYDKGQVSAENTELFYFRSETTSETTMTESRNLAEMSTVCVTDSKISIQPSTYSFSNNTNEEAIDETKDELSETVAVTSLDDTIDVSNYSKIDESLVFGKIGGRRSYKEERQLGVTSTEDDTDRNERHSSERFKMLTEQGPSNKDDAMGRSGNPDQDHVLTIAEEMEGEVIVKEKENFAEYDVLKGVKEYSADIRGIISEKQEDMDTNQSVLVADDTGSEISGELEETSEDESNESKLSDVICISSGDETTQSQSTTTSSNDGTSSSSSESSSESIETDGNQDEQHLLYGDLDVQRPFSQPESISSKDSETSYVPISEPQNNVAKIDSKTFDTCDGSEASTEQSYIQSFTFTNSSFSNSGLCSAPPSGMSLNVLTGEYEQSGDDDHENFARPTATSTKIMQIDTAKSNDEMMPSVSNKEQANDVAPTEAEDITSNQQETKACESQNRDAPTPPLSVTCSTSDKGTTEEIRSPDKTNSDTSKLNQEDANDIDNNHSFLFETKEHQVSSENTENMETDKPQSISSEPEPLTSSQSVDSQRKQETPEKTTDELRLNVSDDEMDAASHDNRQYDEKNTKTPVKSTLENNGSIESGRVLRSARRRSTSIDNIGIEIENQIISPANTNRSLRAASLPRVDSSETPTRSKLRRRSNSIDNPSTATRVLTRRTSVFLDKIVEDTILDSPRRSTRKRTIEVDLKEMPRTPTAMVKRTRKTSTSSVDTPDTAAIQRTKGILSEDNTQMIGTRRASLNKSTPKVTPKRSTKGKTAGGHTKKTSTPEAEISSQSASETDDEEQLEGSPEDMVKVKGAGVRKLFTMASTSKDASVDKSEAESTPEKTDDIHYTTTRRLTRNQQNVMEKSASITKKLETIPKKVTRRQGSKYEGSPNKRDDISETESVISTRSKRSTASNENRRMTRSASIQKIEGDDDDDVVSIASSSRSKRSAKGDKKPKSSAIKDKSLNAIREEEYETAKKSNSNYNSEDDATSTQSGASKELTNKKGRAKKPQK